MKRCLLLLLLIFCTTLPSVAHPPAILSWQERAGISEDIPAGTAVRFEPGQTRDVQLVELAGKREIYGFQQKVMGKL